MRRILATGALLACCACSPTDTETAAPVATLEAEAPVATEPAPLQGAELIERGEYLVIGAVGCNDCHTAMTPTGPDMAHPLQGADLAFAPIADMPWAPHAPALAGGPAGYTEEQFVNFLSTGVRPDGSTAKPPMPQFRLNSEDARAVVAFIRSLPAGEPG